MAANKHLLNQHSRVGIFIEHVTFFYLGSMENSQNNSQKRSQTFDELLKQEELIYYFYFLLTMKNGSTL